MFLKALNLIKRFIFKSYFISFFGLFFLSFASYCQRNSAGLNSYKSTESGNANFVESCGNTWLNVTNYNGGVRVGDLDVTGNIITIEARFNRTIPYTRGRLYAGDIVSKHKDVTNTNYLLRPNSAEITTTNGYYITPSICEIDTNKTYHVAMVYDGKILKFYRNGFLMSQVAATGSLIQNDFLTTIGDLAYQPGFGQEGLIGYIDEVRIWNVARTQSQIRAFMNQPLPNPSTQNGLLAYYTFDDLKNKQGNSAWDGSIFGNAIYGTSNVACATYITDSCDEIVTTPNIVTADFSLPDTVCINTPITIDNLSKGGTNFYWNFNVADINSNPEGTNLGNIGGLFSLPVFTDQVYVNGNYYVFVVNNYPGGLVRLDFGNSMLNTPTPVNLGDVGGIISNNAEGIQVVQSNGKWYALIVGGYPAGGVPSRIIKIDFGTNITNTSPIGTNWGNIGNLNYPIDLHVFQENNNWYGFTVNSENNTITRFNFGANFDNPPTAVNLGNLGGALNYPTGIYAINNEGFWSVFVTNGSDHSSITRLDFGASLLGNPTAVNLGNISNTLYRPRDIYIMKFCGELIGFVVNGLETKNDIVRLDFNNNLLSSPTAVSLGNIGDLYFPHSLSQIFRVGADLYTMITNVRNNTITRLRFIGSSNSNIPNSSDSIPPVITYDSAGIYNVHLMVDEGLPTQTSICKSIVVKDCFVSCNVQPEFSFSIDSCDVKEVHFKNETINTDSVKWILSDGTVSNTADLTHNFTSYGNYSVKLIVTDINGCTDSVVKNINVQLLQDNIILTADTSICAGKNLQLNATDAFSYCWSPVNGLSNPRIKNPIANISQPVTYYLTSQSYGTNLIVNGDFSQGNIGFTSSYSYSSSGIPPAVYFVGNNPVLWNPGMTPCTDHTSGTGNMMLVNGSEQENVIVWSQTVKVIPNTNYAFSTWLETITNVNPAQLQFSINGVPIGSIFNSDNNSCVWHRFYTLWNSGVDTSAVISIINKNINFNGNDFALDDISFSELLVKQDSVKLTLAQPPLVNLGPDSTTCLFDSVLLNAGNPGATYLWQDGTTGQTYLAKDSGLYYVKVTNTSGCSAKDSVYINNFTAINLRVANDTTICTGNPLNLFANGNNIQTYSWSPPATLSNTTIQNPVASPLDTTLYLVNVTDVNGCKQSDSVKVNVAPLPVVSTVSDTTICAGTNIILSSSATMGVNYSWSPSGSLSNSNAASPTASPSATTQYIVTVKTPANCKSSDTVNVVVNPVPALNVASARSLLCIGDSTSISATSPTAISYNWSPTAGLNNPSVSSPTATPTATTNYRVNVTDVNGCISQDSVLISIKQKPVFAINPSDAGICTGESVTLTASGGDEYTWYPPTSLSSPNAAVTNASPTTSTTYKVAITDNICAVSDTLSTTVNITELTAIDVTKSNDVDCILGTTMLRATGGVTYNWYPATYLSDSTIASPIAAPLETTVYHVQVTNATGCTGTDSITVYVYKGEVANGYKLPSAFTPNNDGNNDCFGVRKWGTLSNLDFSIYDRWGVLLFHTKNPSDCWNGTYNGKPQPPGTYVYQIRAQALCGTVYRKGTVVLIR